MKPLQLIFVFSALIILTACNNKETNYEYDTEFDFKEDAYSQNQNGKQYTNINQPNQKTINKKSIKAYTVMSQQFGMPFAQIPIPKSWNRSNNKQENILFENTDGVKVYNEYFDSFTFSNSQQMNQIAQQQGRKVQQIKPVQQVIEQDLKPYLQSQGISFVKQYPLPQMAQLDKQFDSALFKATPEQKQYQCMVTEWTDNKGNNSIGVIRYYVTQYSIGGYDWGYTINSMESPSSIFEEAKKDFLNALLNTQYNPQWIQANNQYYAQMAQQGNARHQQNMAAIKAQGQAILNNGKIYSSIADSNHESWKRRNAMNDAGHSSSVDAIWERRNMTDQSGNLYQIEGYDNNVWLNNNNEYIGTDNPNWNPNIDQMTNNQQWQQLDEY